MSLRMTPKEWRQHRWELLGVNLRGYTRDLGYLLCGDFKVPTTFPERLRRVLNKRKRNAT